MSDLGGWVVTVLHWIPLLLSVVVNVPNLTDGIRGLQRPGDAGVLSAHGQAHSVTKKTIYVSPSVEYAAFPCYAQFFEVAENHWVQIVLQCRVRPESL